MSRIASIALLCAACSFSAWAEDVRIDAPWVRATAPGQKVAGGFMQLTAPADMALVGGESAASASLELHTMKMANGMMEMRQVPEIALPKGATVKLEPGGLHVMLIGLKQQIRPGEKVPMTLLLRGPDGKTRTLKVEADARQSGGSMPHAHH